MNQANTYIESMSELDTSLLKTNGKKVNEILNMI